MADTIRNKQDLNVLLRDNGNNELSAQDIRDILVSMNVHGQIGSVGADSITLDTGWNTVVFDAANSLKRGVTLNTTDYRIEDVPVDMGVDLFYSVDFKGAVDTDYEFVIYKNGATSPARVPGTSRTKRVVDADEIVTVSCGPIAVNLDQDDTIELAVNAGAVSFEVLSGLLKLKRLGVE